jgi:periplasmic mercuric ion binding protein
MRRMIILALALLAFVTFAGTTQTVVLVVQNMTCGVCPITVRKALEQVPGVTDAKIDFDRKTASITFDPDRANLTDFTKATAEAGYPSSLQP